MEDEKKPVFSSCLISAERLESIYQEFSGALLEKLLMLQDLSPAYWREVLTQVLWTDLDLEQMLCSRDVELDISNRIKVKKIPGGNLSEIQVLRGEVFSNHVIRKDMPLEIENGRILLVKGSIAFHRDVSKYVTLENLLALEEEYVKKTCSKIISFKPDLIIVEHSVTRRAQEILKDAGVAVVLNVKAKVIERISWMFKATIVSSINSILTIPVLGRCHRFRVANFEIQSREQKVSLPHRKKMATTNPITTKSLIYLESGEEDQEYLSSLGFTILLRGGTMRELTKVKRILKEMILFLSHSIRERSFLMQVSFTRESLHFAKLALKAHS